MKLDCSTLPSFVPFNQTHANQPYQVAAVQESYASLKTELSEREPAVRQVQAQGERLAKEGHPAVKHIEAYVVAMSTQWAWIMQLVVCLETHLKHATEYHQVGLILNLFIR